MRIALFTETYLPHINGVVTHVKSLRDGLEQLGHDVLIVTADASAKRHYESNGVLHCPAYTSQKFYGYDLAMPLSATRLKYVKRFAPDVIHVHQEFGIGVSGVMIAKALRIALVYTLHTMYDEYIYYIAPPPLVPMTTKMSHSYTKMFAKAAQEVTGPSQKCADYFLKAGVYKPVNVIPNPVDLDMFQPNRLAPEEKTTRRKQLGYDDQTLLGIFVGRLGREKSIDILLNYWKESIAAEENIRLLIIGEGPCKQELEEQAQKLGITDQVQFLGKVLHDQIPPYFACCDFYITASTSDTNSISMLEGMAIGLPVLQITDPLNEGQVCDGVNGFIFGSADEMAQAIATIQNMDMDMLLALRHSARQSVEKSGSVDLARYVLKVYHNALKHKNRYLRLLKTTQKRALNSMKKNTQRTAAMIKAFPKQRIHIQKKETPDHDKTTL